MNEKGFGLVEGLLVAIIVLILGFGGYYVWNENQDDEEASTKTTDVAEADKADSETETRDEEESGTPEGWTEFSSEELGLSFYYPTEWGEVSLNQADDYSDIYRYVSFSGDDALLGSIVSEASAYIGEGRGGAYWEILENEGSFQDIVNPDFGQLLASGNRYSVSVYGSCVTGDGIILEANYDVSSLGSSVDIMRLATTYTLPQGQDCTDVPTNVLNDALDNETVTQLEELSGYIST